jgi:hypothetical protein
MNLPVSSVINRKRAFQSSWQSAILFALIGPPIGLAVLLLVPMAIVALTDMRRAMDLATDLQYVELILVLTYMIGAPAAFVTGAIAGFLSTRSWKKFWVVATSILIGALSCIMAMIIVSIVMDVVINNRATSRFGLVELTTCGTLGAISAAVCAFLLVHRRTNRAR